MEQQFVEEMASSPGSMGYSPLGALTEATTRRLFIDLISTLNASFPDYDFTCLSPEQFTKELSPELVVRNINTRLADFVSTETLEELWLAVEEAVQMNQCQVFSYVPDLDSDPFSDQNVLWSFNFFFFNKHLKRILYFTCLVRSSNSPYLSEAQEKINDDDDIDQENNFHSRHLFHSAPSGDDAFDEEDDFNMEIPPQFDE
eukprot:CAMPEP_0197295022 /NCGR_PEP_ID=MMETSP0890-20130614/34199_1 /TAXON_ID=44058 ORGANISM="Aureoumbra lagunensis, Strain CCMP1510" /NCGR_SAMPLE_ID=MMETSP0890 /ASSEMBLY_ACC=CAM_ASM_000533 /LENGTH=200 /DNA_ID=CAMNT_0042770747 /DNA_START=223 /DNA_END=825 /DNA_ORIENTATION=-